MNAHLIPSDPMTMDVFDLQDDVEFAQRQPRPRDTVREIEAMQRLANVFATSPQHILRELMAIAIELCGADSAGVSLEEPAPLFGRQFRWIATAGAYAPLLGTVLPSQFTPSGTCLDRNRPQLVRISKTYFDSIGVDAPPLTDGMLIPWEVNGTRGTIWAAIHNTSRSFNLEDFRILQDLSDFAAIAIRDQALREKLTRQAAAAMANDLAHRINNPLQKLMNTVFLASQGGTDADIFARQATDDLLQLSMLVQDILQQPALH